MVAGHPCCRYHYFPMVAGQRIQLTRNKTMVAPLGIEPSQEALEHCVGVELTSTGYRPVALPSMLTVRKLEPALGIKPRSLAYRARALPLSYAGWSGWPVTIRRLQFGRLRPCHWTTPA